jgi:hypothetical protein
MLFLLQTPMTYTQITHIAKKPRDLKNLSPVASVARGVKARKPMPKPVTSDGKTLFNRFLSFRYSTKKGGSATIKTEHETQTMETNGARKKGEGATPALKKLITWLARTVHSKAFPSNILLCEMTRSIFKRRAMIV